MLHEYDVYKRIQAEFESIYSHCKICLHFPYGPIAEYDHDITIKGKRRSDGAETSENYEYAESGHSSFWKEALSVCCEYASSTLLEISAGHNNIDGFNSYFEIFPIVMSFIMNLEILGH